MDGSNPPNSGDEVEGVDLDICGDIAEVAGELLQMCDEFRLMAMSAIGPKQG
ncbi:hypothetical protein [Stenotrophomonas indicatrix]|uniref:hypothetical protein n=1 Tax=Stenotrophomonas indicatrix TaxID=2045451 RepID=UPI0013DAF982|nr:hypothetical protein [Stenotrophomonas indicatrix]